jgi:transposase
VARQRRVIFSSSQGALHGERSPVAALWRLPALITIGIDPHKSSLTAVALGAAGQQLAARRIPVNAGTFTALSRWASRWPQRRFAVEGANGLGRGIAQQLAAASENVLDVPATLAARARLLATGGGRKTDAADAASVAHVALRHHGLRQVKAEDQTTILRLLADRRDELAHERTRILNRLHGLLRETRPRRGRTRTVRRQGRRHAAGRTSYHRHQRNAAAIWPANYSQTYAESTAC